MPRKKSLLIGINYFGTKHQLSGCINDAMNMRDYLTRDRGFSPDPRDMVVMTDAPDKVGTPFYPTGQNMIAAFHWLVTGNKPGDSVFLSYSGHGSQIRDPDGDRESGHGQLDSDLLHKTLVSQMPPYARLTILFDCCHSGSAVELPYVYRPNSKGEVNLMDNVKQGMSLLSQANKLVHGGFSVAKINDAKALVGGAKSFFNALQHRDDGPVNEHGLGEEVFVEDWKHEGKDVWMFSGCADNQTSADTSIAGAATGAMSYGFIKTMRENPSQTYVQVLQNTRQTLAHGYKQIPQLSVGGLYDLNQKVSMELARRLDKTLNPVVVQLADRA